MQFWILFIALNLVLSFPAFAQDLESSISPDYQKRAELAKEMHKIRPIRLQIEEAMDVLAQDYPVPERVAFKAGIRKSIQFDKLEQESIKIMVDLYTVEELQAMVGFHGSQEGRAIYAKESDYISQMNPLMTRMIDKAIMNARLGTGR